MRKCVVTRMNCIWIDLLQMSFISSNGVVCSTRIEAEKADAIVVDPKEIVQRVETVANNHVLGGDYSSGFYPGTQSVYDWKNVNKSN